MNSKKRARFNFARSTAGFSATCRSSGLTLIETLIALGISLAVIVSGGAILRAYLLGGKEAILRHREIDLGEYIANQTDHRKTFPTIPYCSVGSFVQVRDLKNQVLIKSDQSTVLNGMKLRAICAHKETGEFRVEFMHVQADGNPKKMPLTGKTSGWMDLYEGIPLVREKCARNTYLDKTYKMCPGAWTFSEAAGKCPHLGMTFVTITAEAENAMITDTVLARFGCSTVNPFIAFWVGNAKPSSSARWPSGKRIYHSKEPTGDGPRIQLMRYCNDPYGWNDLIDFYPNGTVCKAI